MPARPPARLGPFSTGEQSSVGGALTDAGCDRASATPLVSLVRAEGSPEPKPGQSAAVADHPPDHPPTVTVWVTLALVPLVVAVSVTL